MHIKNLETWKHSHDFAVIHKKGERRTARVLFLTAATMVIEIIAGAAFGSMALLADGWHMGTHVAAFMITIFAYKYARKHQNTSRFTFGTGKVTVLGGFASAVALFVVALVMSVESVQRIFAPQIIHFNEAIGVAVLGLFVNVVCAFTLQADHEHLDEHSHQSHDHNLKAAYYHVLADALTSVLAIIALVSGKMFGWNWLDPVMGIIGAVVITRWSYILLKETSPILLDENIEENRRSLIRGIIESDSDNRICDLHLWKVGPNDYAVLVSLVTHFPKPVEYYKNLLKDIDNLSHMTIEINQCMSDPCIVANSGLT
ncbi:MAG: cation transporter [Desulfobacteraceae bacterium]|nr:MAG: cation transporter [Desulfobacteraceae bacterium]